mmetsp:Transcript_10990/g.33709  ORF Transcript_10990/g.33709 Transcript_10990/m.33709 type:complete len:270 (+) Transcript_10990:223-1032(+)
MSWFQRTADHPHAGDFDSLPTLAKHVHVAEQVLANVLNSLEPAGDQVGRHKGLLELMIILVLAEPEGVTILVQIVPEPWKSLWPGICVGVLTLPLVENHRRWRQGLIGMLLLLCRCSSRGGSRCRCDLGCGLGSLLCLGTLLLCTVFLLAFLLESFVGKFDLSKHIGEMLLGLAGVEVPHEMRELRSGRCADHTTQQDCQRWDHSNVGKGNALSCQICMVLEVLVHEAKDSVQVRLGILLLSGIELIEAGKHLPEYHLREYAVQIALSN